MAQFQFTHPGRGATHDDKHTMLLSLVSIHAPREGCDISLDKIRARSDVSIHAPREGCDTDLIRSVSSLISFNSRTPGGVRLLSNEIPAYEKEFQFTHPGRGATHILKLTDAFTKFQFTHPGRGATQYNTHANSHLLVSIHAPREGCDLFVFP